MAPDQDPRLLQTLASLEALAAEEADAQLRELATVDPILADQVQQCWRFHLAGAAHPVPTNDYVGEPAAAGLLPGTGAWLPEPGPEDAYPASSTNDFVDPVAADTVLEPTLPVLADSRYRIEGELGRGAFGAVYQGTDTRTSQSVALKAMHRRGSQALGLFKGEFRYLQGIAHPNLVQLLGLESDGTGWLIAMEYVEGVDFLAFVRRRGQAMDYGRLRSALGQLVEGVAALHGHRRLHRDLKPQNVRVTPAGRVVVLDFGLAAEAGPNGELRYVDASSPGTVPYMAPEQFGNPPVSSTASDLYAIGVILYEALTGRRPFVGNLLHVVRAKEDRDPAPPCELNPEVPEDLNALCMGLLAREAEGRPAAAVVLRALGQDSDRMEGAIPRQGEGPLLGRDEHLLRLGEAYADSRRGAVVVRIFGPSGIGKSALVGYFTDRLRADGVVVLAGRCYEHESVPYKALDPLVDELARYLHGLPEEEVAGLIPLQAGPLVRVFPILDRVGPIERAASGVRLSPDVHELRRAAFAGLRELLTKLAGLVPLVLSVDDLQWGDVDSARLLSDLLSPPDPPCALWLLSHRSEVAASPCLGTLAESFERAGVKVRELAIEPLDEGEVRDLVVRLLGPGEASRAGTIARESGGNPFFVTELIQRARSADTRESERSEKEDLTLDGLIRARVSRLPEGARRLLELVAVSGRPVGEVEAYRAAGASGEGRTVMAQLEAGRLLRGMGVAEELRLETYHDRVREAVTAGLDATTRRGYHGRLAVVLEESGRAEVDELAVHFEGAGQEEKAGVYYGQAADRAAGSLAFDQAAGFYRKALELGRLRADEARRLRVKLAEALANAGRGAEAGPEYLVAAEGASGVQELEFLRSAMRQFLVSGGTQEGMEILTSLLRRFGMQLPIWRWWALAKMIGALLRLKLRGTGIKERPAESLPAELLQKIDTAHDAVHSLGYVNMAWSLWLQALYARWALDAGEPRRAAEALAAVGFMTASEGPASFDRAERYSASALKMSTRLGDPQTKRAGAPLLGNNAVGDGPLERPVGPSRSGRTDSCRAASLHRCLSYHPQALPPGRADDGGPVGGVRRPCRSIPGGWSPEGGQFRRLGHECPLLPAGAGLGKARPGGGAHSAWVGGLASGGERHGRVLGPLWTGGSGPLSGGGTCRGRPARSRKQSIGKPYPFQPDAGPETRNGSPRGPGCAGGRRGCAPRTVWPFGGRQRLLWRAEGRSRQIERGKAAWSNPLAFLLRAGVANLRGRSEEAVRQLATAEGGLEAADMRMYAAAARRQRGRLLGGAEGEKLVQQADALMKAEGVREPARIAAVLVPGFPE